MSDIPPLHDSDSVRDDSTAASHAPGVRGVAELVVAGAWLLVLAAQYYGTFQRTALQTEGTAPSLEFAQLDLTPLYYLLVAATLALMALRIFGHLADSRRAVQAAPEATTEAMP